MVWLNYAVVELLVVESKVVDLFGNWVDGD